LTTGYYISPTHSVECSSEDNDLMSKDIDTSGKKSVKISFKYRVDDVDDSDNLYVVL